MGWQERWPFKRHGRTPEQVARKEVGDLVKDIQAGRIDKVLLLKEVDGQEFCTVLGEPQLRIPTVQAYGMLDLNGRMPNHHSAPRERPSGNNTLRIFTHPNVFKELEYVVFEAVEMHGPDGKRKYVDVWGKRRTAYDGELLSQQTNSKPEENVSPKIESADTLEAKLGIY